MKPIEEVKNKIEEAINESLIGVIYIDIDNLMVHNDCFGHMVGDQTIERVSNAISSMVQHGNTIFKRIAGDKFIIILFGESALNTFELADGIHSKVKSLNICLVNKEEWYPEQAKSYPDQITVSVGAFVRENSGPSMGYSSTVLELADASCYFAKFAGKDKVIKIDLR